MNLSQINPNYSNINYARTNYNPAFKNKEIVAKEMAPIVTASLAAVGVALNAAILTRPLAEAKKHQLSYIPEEHFANKSAAESANTFIERYAGGLSDIVPKILVKGGANDSEIEIILENTINQPKITNLISRLESVKCRNDLEVIEKDVELLPEDIKRAFQKELIPSLRYKVSNHAEGIKWGIEYSCKHRNIELNNNKEYSNFVNILDQACSDDFKPTNYERIKQAAEQIKDGELKEIVLGGVSQYEEYDKAPLKTTEYEITDKYWAPQANRVEISARNLLKRDLNLVLREQIYYAINERTLNDFGKKPESIKLSQQEKNQIKQLISGRADKYFAEKSSISHSAGLSKALGGKEDDLNKDEYIAEMSKYLERYEGLAKTLLSLRNVDGTLMYNANDIDELISSLFFCDRGTDWALRCAKDNVVEFPAANKYYIFAPWNGIHS